MSDTRDPGDAWVTAADGRRYWGQFGAAGLLAYDRARNSILMQYRVTWSDHGDTWGIPGGARHEHEDAPTGAIREAQEEAGVPDDAVAPRYTHVLDRGGWTYTTLLAKVTTPFEPQITDPESHALAWVPLDEVVQRPLHPGFADSWPLLRPLLTMTPVVVVDAANVVGSVPDGWWKDRRAAAARLRDRIGAVIPDGIRSGLLGLPETEIAGLDRAYPEWVLVVEGAARGFDPGGGSASDIDSVGDDSDGSEADAVAAVGGAAESGGVGVITRNRVRVVEASGSGDDAVVDQVARLAATSRVTVITSDRELRERSLAAGAVTARGPRDLLGQLPALP